MSLILAEQTQTEGQAIALDELEAHLQSRLSGRVWELKLEWRDGGVVLHGQAHTYYAKQLAQHAAMEARLPIRVNEIDVS